MKLDFFIHFMDYSADPVRQYDVERLSFNAEDGDVNIQDFEFSILGKKYNLSLSFLWKSQALSFVALSDSEVLTRYGGSKVSNGHIGVSLRKDSMVDFIFSVSSC